MAFFILILKLLHLSISINNLKCICTDIMTHIDNWICMISIWFHIWSFRTLRITSSSYVFRLSSLQQSRFLLSLFSSKHHSRNSLINIFCILNTLYPCILFLVLFICTLVILLLIIFCFFIGNCFVFLVSLSVLFVLIIILWIDSLNFRDIWYPPLSFFITSNLNSTLIMSFGLMFDFSILI